MEPISRTFTIHQPTLSTAPISIHTLTYSPTPCPPPPAPIQTPPAILFLPYWGGSASTSHRIPPLLQSLFQRQQSPTTPPPTMVSLSFRGSGLSGPAIPDAPHAYSIRALADDTIAVLLHLQAAHLLPPGLDGLGDFVLCGHSMGAKVALAVAGVLADPHSSRPRGPRLRGLLLLAPAPPGPLIVPGEVRAQMEHAYDSAESVRATVRQALAGDGGKRLESSLNGDDMGMIVRDGLAGSEGAKKGWLEVGMSEDIRGSLAADQATKSELKVRVLVARSDRVETAERVEAETVNVLKGVGIPDVKYRVLEPATNPGREDYGHLLPLEAPQAVAEELLALLDDIAGKRV